MREFFELVVIDLNQADDPHIIFETLNARGTPLLPSDMIVNQILYQAGISFDAGMGHCLRKVSNFGNSTKTGGDRRLDRDASAAQELTYF